MSSSACPSLDSASALISVSLLRERMLYHKNFNVNLRPCSIVWVVQFFSRFSTRNADNFIFGVLGNNCKNSSDALFRSTAISLKSLEMMSMLVFNCLVEDCNQSNNN